MTRALPAVAALAGALLLAATCALPPEDFGRPCESSCDHGFICFDGACVPPDFPLLDDAGPSDAGAGDAGLGDAGLGDAGLGDGPEDAGAGPVPGEDCSNAIHLDLGVTVAGDTTGAADDNSDSTNCDGVGEFPAPDLVYQIDMPAGQALHVTAQSDVASYFMFAKVLTSCTEVAVACQASATHTIDLVVPSPPAGPLFIMIDGFTSDDFGPFTLRATAE